MATLGKLEARITVPSGGWAGTINDSGGGGFVAWTVASGDYYLSSANADGGSSFIAAFETALNTAAPTDTIGVSIGAGESGAGTVQITSTGTTEITWTDVDCRNMLGFTSDLAANTVWAGSNHARGLFLPNIAFLNLNGGDYWRGWHESDLRVTENAAGYLFAFSGQRKRVCDLAWQGIKRQKTWIVNESKINESFEKFYLDVILGEGPFCYTPCGPVRFYPDADDSSVFGTYRFGSGLEQWRPDQMFANYAGQWVLKLPRMVQVPGTESLGIGRQTIAYTAKTSGSSTTDGTTFTTASVTPGNNSLMVVAVLSMRTTSGVESPTVTGTGITYDLVTYKDVQSGTQRLSIYRGMVSSGTASAISIVHTVSHDSCAWAVLQYDNVNTSGTNGAGAVIQWASANTPSATSLGVSLASLEVASNRNVTAIGLSTNASVTPDADFTERTDNAIGSNNGTLETQDAANQQNCTASFSSAAAAIISLEIRAA